VEITSPLTPDAALAAEIESHDFYYKIPQVRSVEFATAAGSMATLEGDVAVEVGDALMTGSEGRSGIVNLKRHTCHTAKPAKEKRANMSVAPPSRPRPGYAPPELCICRTTRAC
jgi:hypothetical protein